MRFEPARPTEALSEFKEIHGFHGRHDIPLIGEQPEDLSNPFEVVDDLRDMMFSIDGECIRSRTSVSSWIVSLNQSSVTWWTMMKCSSSPSMESMRNPEASAN